MEVKVFQTLQVCALDLTLVLGRRELGSRFPQKGKEKMKT